MDAKDLSQHRFLADRRVSPSREGSRKQSVSSPPSKPVRRKSNESGESLGACQDGDDRLDSLSYDNEENSLLFLFKDEEESVPSMPNLIRRSTYPEVPTRKPCSPSAYETLSFSPEQKKKTFQIQNAPPRIIYITLQDQVPLSDDDTLSSENRGTEEGVSSTMPIVIKTKSYSMTSEKSSAQSPSKPVRRSFEDDPPPRNASFKGFHGLTSPKMLPGIATTMIKPTVSNAGNDNACMHHIAEKNSLLSPTLKSPSIIKTATQSLKVDLRDPTAKLNGADRKNPSTPSDDKVGSPLLERTRSSRNNMFFQNLTWDNNKGKQSSKARRKRNTESPKLPEEVKPECSAMIKSVRSVDPARGDAPSNKHRSDKKKQISKDGVVSAVSLEPPSQSPVPSEVTGNSTLELCCRWHSSPSVGLKNIVKRVYSSERMPGKPKRSSSNRQNLTRKVRLDRPSGSVSCRQIQPVRSFDADLMRLSKRKDCVKDMYSRNPLLLARSYPKDTAHRLNLSISSLLVCNDGYRKSLAVADNMPYPEATLGSLQDTQRCPLAAYSQQGCFPECTCMTITECKLRGMTTRSSADRLLVFDILSTVEVEFREQG
jgi:hypothetical protein